MNKEVFAGFVTNFFSGFSSIDIKSKGVAGNRDFVAWDWYMEMVPKDDVPAFGLKKDELKRLNGISLVWWKNEGDAGGYEGWKVVKAKDFSCPAPAA